MNLECDLIFVPNFNYIWDEMIFQERPRVEKSIAEAVESYPGGSILFVDDFLDYGSPESVKKALFRLNEKEVLFRLAHGIYLFPKRDPELGNLFPSTDDIAKAIARRDKAHILPTGVHALNKLGLSTQIPMKVVYLTDGTARTVTVGKRTIAFRRTSPKNLLMQGEISSLVIQALKTLGQHQIDEEILKRILELLQKEKKQHIVHDAKLSPAWIYKILMNALN